jgi:hypothetical protein
MATIINAGTTTSTALNVTTDTTGAMVLQTSGANAISISNAQVVTLANPLAAGSGGTGISSLGTGIATFLGTPSSANLAAAVTDETGTGALVFAGSPTLTGTPLAPTASPGTSTTQIATTAFVGAAITNATGSLGTMSTQNANNVSITGGSIAGITDLAVADGGTGRSTLASNAVLVGNGTSGINTVAPGASGNLLVSDGTTWASTTNTNLGAGQSWQNVTGSRATDVTYTNTTGRPIFVIAQVGAQTNGIYVYINGTFLIRHWYDVNGGAGQVGYSTAEFIVGNGDTYYVTAGPLRQWWEFR